METIADFYIKRNTRIIRRWLELTSEGVKVRVAAMILAEEFDCSDKLISAVVYNKEYPYAKQAWKIIRNENSENTIEAKTQASAY